MKSACFFLVALLQLAFYTVSGFIFTAGTTKSETTSFLSLNEDASSESSTGDNHSNDETNTKPRLALLTFDLDDTLFPCHKVVDDANQAMVDALHRDGFTQATNNRIVQHTKSIRSRQRKAMTYTDMRKRAIHTEMELWSPEKVDHASAERIYDIWLAERHDSANRNLFDGTVTMLQTILKQHPGVCIAAITNGRGNPLDMEALAEYFEFCVSGEDDNVFPDRKPHPGVFKVSLAEYHKRHPHTVPSDKNIWCHVGDCLGNDVGGSANCGAYAVWADIDELRTTTDPSKPPAYSTASPSQSRSRQKLKDKGRRRVSEKIVSLRELPNAVESILKKANEKSLLQAVQPTRGFGGKRK